jgi:hypothetical protein
MMVTIGGIIRVDRILEPRQRIAGQGAEHHRDRRGAHRDDQAVQRILQERSLDEGSAIMLERRIDRVPFRRDGKDIDVVFEGVAGDPVDREQRDHQRDRDPAIGGDLLGDGGGAAAQHRVASYSASRMRLMNHVLNATVANSTKSEIAAA